MNNEQTILEQSGLRAMNKVVVYNLTKGKPLHVLVKWNKEIREVVLELYNEEKPTVKDIKTELVQDLFYSDVLYFEAKLGVNTLS